MKQIEYTLMILDVTRTIMIRADVAIRSAGTAQNRIESAETVLCYKNDEIVTNEPIW